MPPHHPHDDEDEDPPRPKHHGPPPPPPHHGGLPPPKPHWAAIEGLPDDDVLRYAPPEIRRVWRRVVSIEQQMGEVREALRRIEELLRGRAGTS